MGTPLASLINLVTNLYASDALKISFKQLKKTSDLQFKYLHPSDQTFRSSYIILFYLIT